MEEMKKKILVVDDSALMRRVICDIINSDRRFQVIAKASDGIEAFDLLSREQFSGVVLDINMPRMNGLELLAKLKKYKLPAKVLIASTESREGAAVTLEALELGALDFIRKPVTSFECRDSDFTERFLSLLAAVCESEVPGYGGREAGTLEYPAPKRHVPVLTPESQISENAVVAIASSTGGPKALQDMIPLLPENLNAPVLMVQHMPKGFTASMAARLNELSGLEVREAAEGEILKKGVAYVSMGGKHLNIVRKQPGVHAVHYSEEPAREGVRPCANYMYESLIQSDFSEIICVVLSGMGADGTEGIRNLKQKKNIHVITQNRESCVVYGMPKSVVNAGLSDRELPLHEIAGKITERIGVKTT